MVKNSRVNAGDPRDVCSIPALGRSPGRGNGNPLQYSCPRNSMSRGALQGTVHEAAKSWTKYPNLSLPTPYPLVTISLFSISVTLFLFCRGVHVYLFFKIPYICDIMYLSSSF